MSDPVRKSIAKRAIGLVDLTDLSDTSDSASITELCRRAQSPNGPVAAVCIWPRMIKLAKKLLQGTDIAIATVVNFPGGDQSIEDTVAETLTALDDGADEIDLVIPYRDMLAGDTGSVQAMIVALRTATAGKGLLKVIIESGELKDPDLILRASEIAIAAGADFIKTSTGKVTVNATLDTARIMIGAIAAAPNTAGKSVGFKPAGGIKTTEDCGAYLDIADEIMGPDWASASTFRFGASSVLSDLEAALDGTKAEISQGY